MIRTIFSRALAAITAAALLVTPVGAAVDTGARGLALQAKVAAATDAAKLAPLSDGSIVAGPGDSITANATQYDLTANGSNTWLPKGIFTMLVAQSGGRLRPVDIAGWPYTNTGINVTGFGEMIVVNGGSGYSAGTTCSVQSTVGVAGATCTVTVANGVITAVALTSPGTGYLGQSPIITLTDPLGTGSGAVILAQTAKAGGFASGGIGSAEALGYVPRILNSGAPVARNVLSLIGTNDAPRGLSLAQSKANIVSMYRQLIAGGVRVFAIAPLERNAGAGATAQVQAGALRRWAVSALPTLVPGVVVIDPSPYWLDQATNGTSNPISTANSTDGLHPTTLGAWVLAKAIWAQMSPYFTIGPVTTGTDADHFDATLNPQGNMLPSNAASLISGGTATPNITNEAPWTGTRYANTYLSRVTGGTGTGTFASSIVARTDGKGGSYLQLQVNATGFAAGETLRLTWSTNGTANTLDVSPSVGGATLQVGDRIVGAIDEVVMSNVANIKGLKLKLVAANASNGFPITPTAANIHSGRVGTAAWGDYEDVNFPAFAGDTLYLQTREMVIPTGTARVTMCLEFVVNAAGSASFTAKLGGASLRRLN